MALNIKNPEVEKLATDVALLAEETKTEAIRRALSERKQRLLLHRGTADKRARLFITLSKHIWPQVPPEVLGKSVSKKEREAILGYGPEGV